MGLLTALKHKLTEVEHGWTALLSLSPIETAHLQSSGRLVRAGKIARTLQAAGFADEKVSIILRALFLAQLSSPQEMERQMERAFDVWDISHRGVLDLAVFSHDLSALLASDLEPQERQALADGLGADGSSTLDYDAFREVLYAIGADASERRSRLAALRSYGDDVSLARKALGGAQASGMSRHELRTAGALVRVLERDLWRAEDAAALLPALALRAPTKAQLRVAFGVFDAAGNGEALDAELVRERLSAIVPQASQLVWGGASRGRSGSAAAVAHSVPTGSQPDDAAVDSRKVAGEGEVTLMSFDEFAATLEQLRGALAAHALAAGVHIASEPQRNWLASAVASVGHAAAALAALSPAEAVLLTPQRLHACGRVLTELQRVGLDSGSALAITRVLFLRTDPDAVRDAFLALDLRRWRSACEPARRAGLMSFDAL